MTNHIASARAETVAHKWCNAGELRCGVNTIRQRSTATGCANSNATSSGVATVGGAGAMRQQLDQWSEHAAPRADTTASALERGARSIREASPCAIVLDGRRNGARGPHACESEGHDVCIFGGLC